MAALVELEWPEGWEGRVPVSTDSRHRTRRWWPARSQSSTSQGKGLPGHTGSSGEALEAPHGGRGMTCSCSAGHPQPPKDSSQTSFKTTKLPTSK